MPPAYAVPRLDAVSCGRTGNKSARTVLGEVCSSAVACSTKLSQLLQYTIACADEDPVPAQSTLEENRIGSNFEFQLEPDHVASSLLVERRTVEFCDCNACYCAGTCDPGSRFRA